MVKVAEQISKLIAETFLKLKLKSTAKRTINFSLKMLITQQTFINYINLALYKLKIKSFKNPNPILISIFSIKTKLLFF